MARQKRFKDYPAEPEERVFSGVEDAPPARKSRAGRLPAAGACANDVFPELEHLLVNVCVRRAPGSRGPAIGNADDVVGALQLVVPDVLTDIREHAVILFLDQKHRVVGVFRVSSGGTSDTLVDPRVFFRAAMMLGVSAVIFVHNHPSGGMDPSSDDVGLTQRLVTAGAIVQVKVLDSIIVGVDPTDSSKFVSYSFVEHGIMPSPKPT